MRERKDKSSSGGTPIGTPLLSPLTSASSNPDDEREERRRRRREREAAKEAREKEQTGEAEPHTQTSHHAKRRSRVKQEPVDVKVESDVTGETGKGYEAAGESSVPTTPRIESAGVFLLDGTGDVNVKKEEEL
jgi:hypothetical protein